MAVYGVAQVNIHDQNEYQKYKDGFRDLFFSHGGELLAVDDDVTVVEGDWPFTRMVICRFENEDSFMAWYNSSEYQQLLKFRLNASVGNIVLLKEMVL